MVATATTADRAQVAQPPVQFLDPPCATVGFTYVLVGFAWPEEAQRAPVAGRDSFEDRNPCRDDGGIGCPTVQQTRHNVVPGMSTVNAPVVAVPVRDGFWSSPTGRRALGSADELPGVGMFDSDGTRQARDDGVARRRILPPVACGVSPLMLSPMVVESESVATSQARDIHVVSMGRKVDRRIRRGRVAIIHLDLNSIDPGRAIRAGDA